VIIKAYYQENREFNTTMYHKINKILIALDFSEPSFNALETAACMAKKFDASLYIIHVQDNIFQFMGVNALTVNSVANNSSSIMTALSNDIYRKHGIKPAIIEEGGYATEVILKNAVNHCCDLIILGAYGASGYRNGYIGTTAYSVIKFAPCPVLLIPNGKKWTSFRNPLFPVRPVITTLRHYDTIRNFLEEQSTLSILGLSPSGQEGNMRDLNNLITEIKGKLTMDKISTQVHWNSENSISHTILSQADKNRSDLLIITPAIDVSTKSFYIGPNTHYIVNNAKVPILLINKVNIYALAKPSL
jgi:nucleotide-binding universal stress UspA family protein